MPAIITHDMFAHDIYHDWYETIGGSQREADAFILGNQGPDPLFFSVMSPHLRTARHLGGRMHKEKMSEVLAAFKASLGMLDEKEYPIGRAYALGFLCHYLLDNTVHPFVYYQEYSICDAGVPDIDRRDHSEVHAVVETELDEIMLYSRRGETIATFKPSTQTIRADKETLAIISKMYVYVALVVFDWSIPADTFAASVRNYRVALAALRSPHGVKRAVAPRVECLVKRHSFYESMCHRPVERTECPFDNRDHLPWENPFTGEVSTDSFWDRIEIARSRVSDTFALFDSADFDVRSARTITHDLDFSGRPTGAVLVSVADVESA